MNIDELEKVLKSDIQKLSKNLSTDDIHFLIQALNEKNDTKRYNAFLLLQSSSREFPFVYKYWNDLEKKLENTNSYQRSIGIMLIAENVRWDKDNRFSDAISKYLNCCNDEKFITARQTIQGLEAILKATDKFDSTIKIGLTNLSLSKYRENQQKLLRKDMSNILKIIENRALE